MLWRGDGEIMGSSGPARLWGPARSRTMTSRSHRIPLRLVFALVWVVQLGGMLVLDDLYPVEIYEPCMRALVVLLPEEFVAQGNILLGLSLLIAATLCYALVWTTLFALVRRWKRRSRAA